MVLPKEKRDLQRNVMLQVVNNLGKGQEFWSFYLKSKDLLVSNKGRLKSYKTGKIRKVHKDRSGYYRIKVKLLDDTVLTKRAHQIVLETFLSVKNDGFLEVNHIDGNKENNSFDNLEWVTRKENLKHAFENKLYNPLKGEKNPRSKLSNDDVKNIRKLRKTKTLKYLADKYNVSTTTIYLIVNNKTYKEV